MQPEIRIQAQTKELEARWQQDARWAGIERTYTAADVVRLRGSVVPESTLARLGAERLWQLLHEDEPVRALGALSGGQAGPMGKARVKAGSLSRWQGAGHADPPRHTYPGPSPSSADNPPPPVQRP